MPPPHRPTVIRVLVLLTLLLCFYGLSKNLHPEGLEMLPDVRKHAQELAVADSTPTGWLNRLHGRFGEGEVVVYESGIHDGHFRFGFPKVLSSIAPNSVIIDPYGATSGEAKRRLEVDGIRELILTTCTDSLPKLLPSILPSSAHITCILHHSGNPAFNFRKHLLPLTRLGRVTIVVLGEHVRKQLVAEMLEWGEKEGELVGGGDGGRWEEVGLGVEVFIPVFDYPGRGGREEPGIFPSRAVIQGNIEQGRRNYFKTFELLKESLIENPSLWGYSPPPSADSAAYKPTAHSPFTLHLLGQIPKEGMPEIPVELKEMVKVHEGLGYEGYYSLLNGMDLVVPAFRQGGPYKETTSSSIAAGAITRVPILVSPRHLLAYTYLQPPAFVFRNATTPETSAIEALRKASVLEWERKGDTAGRTKSRASDAEWEEFQEGVLRENVGMWERVLLRGAKVRV